MIARVAVIGAVFIDGKGFAHYPLIPAGKNLGSVQFFHGGIGRNIAENLAHLGIPVLLAATVDDNSFGADIRSRLKKAGVDTGLLLSSPVNGHGYWLAILDCQGNLVNSISQMPDTDFLEQHILGRCEEIIESCTHIVLQMDLSPKISRIITDKAKQAQRIVCGIPGNLSVIKENLALLAHVDCFICNDIEATEIIKIDINPADPQVVLEILADFLKLNGLKSMIVTLGGEGAVYYEAETGQGGCQPAFATTKVVDTSGAGDAFVSATVMAMVRGFGIKEAMVYGAKAATWTIESKENTCPDILKRIERDELLRQMERNR